MTDHTTRQESGARRLVAGLLLVAAIIALQWYVGAYRSEQDIDSDHAAHLMDGLLVRDYVAEALGQNPFAFARDYYVSYPKIAPRVWPPLFHVSLGFFLLPPWPAHGAALMLLALTAAWTAWRLYRMVTLFTRGTTGLIAAVLFLSTPVVVGLTTSIMLDVVVAALAIEATYWFARFMRTERWWHGALFGLFTALCCLTTGAGLSLMFVPVVAIVLTGRYELLRRGGLYIAAAIVLMLALPSLVFAYRVDAAIGDRPAMLMTVVARIGAYFGYLSTQLGPAATLFALIGLFQAIRRSRRWTEDAPLPIGLVLAALVGSSFMLYVLLPPPVGSGAAMTLTFAPVYGLVVIGIGAVSRGVQDPTRRQSVYGALLFALVVGTFFARPALAIRKPIGYRAMMDYLDDQRALAGQRMLVVSDEAGERALVTDVAIRQLHPRPVIVRGSTLLAANTLHASHLNGVASATAILQELEDLHVDYILLDSSPDAVRLPYWPVMKDLVESRGDRLEIEYSTTVDRRNGPTRPLALYRLKHGSPGAARPPQVNLSPMVSKP
jgi:hypothetical protein